MKNGHFKWLLCFVIFIAWWNSNTRAQQLKEVQYQRSSVIQMMIEHPMYMFNDEIAAAFRNLPIPERFNDHNLGVKVVKFSAQEFTDQQTNISSFIRQVRLGNRAIAKWFNWNKNTGKFNMDLIKERGVYNASALDKELASLNVRGSAILADAGENLIPNTYLVMSDICYKGKYSNKEKDMQHVDGNYHQFDVNIVSYIYQLDWNNDFLNEFYSKYYNGTLDFINKADPYNFIFRAKVETDYNETSNQISQSKLIERVVARCLDINMAKLQRAYPDFRIKALITATEPIQAKIGLKECVTPDSKFEVLEMHTDDKGIVTYKRVGIVKPIEGKIWDNRYLADEEGTATSGLGTTSFEIVKGNNFYAGMLLREIE